MCTLNDVAHAGTVTTQPRPEWQVRVCTEDMTPGRRGGRGLPLSLGVRVMLVPGDSCTLCAPWQ